MGAIQGRQDDAARRAGEFSTTGSQTNTYQQTLRIDGVRQLEMNIANPSYPEPPVNIAGVSPADRYLLDPALEHPKNSRVSAGVDYAFSPRIA